MTLRTIPCDRALRIDRTGIPNSIARLCFRLTSLQTFVPTSWIPHTRLRMPEEYQMNESNSKYTVGGRNPVAYIILKQVPS